MPENMLIAAGFILAGILIYRFHRLVLDALKRFDERNVRRIAEEEQDRTDPTAHFRHAMMVAGEQVEEIEEVTRPDDRTGLPVTCYLFEAELFSIRAEAEAARAARIGVIARRFYAELPHALAGRDTRAPLSARERAARRWRRRFH